MLCYSREEILIEILITDDLVWIFWERNHVR